MPAKDLTLVVNLFGAPGSGKSTGAAYIFALLKMAGINAELVTEFVKDKVWEETSAVFKNQAYIFGQQYYRITRCLGKVDAIITDSPLLLSVQYNPERDETFNQLVLNKFDSLENKNYFLKRTKPYCQSGRIHTESESDKIAIEIKEMLNRYGITYTSKDGTKESYEEIAKEIIQLLECGKAV